MTRTGFILALLALGGCAVATNVMPLGNGVFMTAVHSNDVNARAQQVSEQAIAQAAAYCKEHGTTVEIVRADAPVSTPGRPPSVEVDFRCR